MMPADCRFITYTIEPAANIALILIYLSPETQLCVRPFWVKPAVLAQEASDNKKFEDVAYFEPFYLKDFVATTPKKSLF